MKPVSAALVLELAIDDLFSGRRFGQFFKNRTSEFANGDTGKVCCEPQGVPTLGEDVGEHRERVHLLAPDVRFNDNIAGGRRERS